MRRPLPLLLTGFEPFGRFAVNPSWHAVSAAAERFGDRVVAVLLPVDHHAARRRLLDVVNHLRPQAVLCTGLAAGDVFRCEQIARKPAEFADLSGHPVRQGTWPWAGTEAALRAADAPVRRSIDAGKYVCEATYWSILDAGLVPGPVGFLHVPAESGAFPVARTAAAVVDAVAVYLGQATDA